MFIVITGLDGSGASTVAKKLHELDEGSILLKTPSAEFSDRESIDRQVRTVSPYAHYLYYLSANVYISDYIRKNFDYKAVNVYCVRYLIDTTVSHRVAGLEVQMDYETHNLLKPDLTIFVKTDEEIRQQRIIRRGKSVLDKVLDDDETRAKFLAEFKNCLQYYQTFDNTPENIDENIKEFFKHYIIGR
ncbi:MAG: AAA family ATPase [Selenomonadaceae bacterium]|nr:AAA family ATPase [Selenomonadaceae bacterium]